MARQCNLQCHFFQSVQITENDVELTKIIQLYCQGPLVESCRRRELYLSGKAPEKNMTPKGSFIDNL